MSQTTNIDVRERSPIAQGLTFGTVGAYERIRARVAYSVDPEAPASRDVEDMANAKRGVDGRIHFHGDVLILKPVDLVRGNGRLLFDFPNRGNLRSLQFFNDAPWSNDPKSPADAGNGFLMRRGYLVVAAGWQGDVVAGDDRFVLEAPMVEDASPTRIRTEYIVDRQGVFSLPLSGRAGTRSYPAASLDTAHATLTRRRYPESRRWAVRADRWQFARLDGGGRGVEGDGKDSESAIVASRSHLYLRGGFEPGWIYELEYEATGSIVLGAGLLAIRNLVSFLRHAQSSDNPVYQPGFRIERAYAWGRSQSGRCVRDFVYRGCNADDEGRRVFDGVITHIAGAGRTTMRRFSNLVVASSRQYEDHDNPADAFPFAYGETTDHATGRSDAILKRPQTDPLVVHTQTATEYWQRRGSLVHTDTRGADLEIPSNARVYFWASSQHWADPNATVPPRGVCENRINIVATSMLFRAHLDALDSWASTGRDPPASRVPRRADGTLVTFEEWRVQFPTIPGIRLPLAPNMFGPLSPTDGNARSSDSGYAVLVPAVDGDGNDSAGIRAPMVAAPLGTYTGWNLRSRGHGEGALHDFSGSYMPFADSPDEMTWSGDPRPAVLSRYRNADAYVEAIHAAAVSLVEERLMLAEDVERVVAAAKDWSRPRHVVGLETAPNEPHIEGARVLPAGEEDSEWRVA